MANFLIGWFAKSDIFHWSRCFCQYLDQYLPSPNKISTMHISYTYIVNENLIFHMCIFEPTLSKLHYDCKNDNINSVTLHLSVPLRYLNLFQCPPHNIFTTYNSSYLFLEMHITFFTETHDNATFPHKTGGQFPQEQEKQLIRL